MAGSKYKNIRNAVNRKELNNFLSTQWARANPKLLVKPDSYYFMISRDGKEVQPKDPFFPYSSHWNAYCPLEEIKISVIESISDLKRIKVEYNNISNYKE